MVRKPTWPALLLGLMVVSAQFRLGGFYAYVTERLATRRASAPALLALLPEAPVLVLSRSPLGVASSFMRGDLFRRWGYRSRYQQMVTMTRHGNSSARQFAALAPDDNPADLVALVRLQVLNTVLMADALARPDAAAAQQPCDPVHALVERAVGAGALAPAVEVDDRHAVRQPAHRLGEEIAQITRPLRRLGVDRIHAGSPAAPASIVIAAAGRGQPPPASLRSP